IDEVLDGKAVSQPKTDVAGCLIARATKPKTEGPITFTKNVASILQNRCQECHRPGQVGPMPLLTYDDAQAWSATIREVIEEQRMPPWYADPRFGKFENDRSLTKEERDTLLAWIDQGCRKGDDKDLPKRREFAEGWTIGKPDLVLTMKEEFEVPAEMPRRGVPYKRFEVDPGFKEDVWVSRAEARPGSPEVVHHIVVFISEPKNEYFPGNPRAAVLAGTAPGDMPLMLPPGTAKKIVAGSKIIFEMHYTPNGKAQKDRSSLGLIFAKEPPKHRAVTIPVANPTEIEIPPEDGNYKAEASFYFREDAYILNFMPHMHLRGKDFLYEAVYPDGKTETLLSVPRYNFNWQSVYRFAKPVHMPKGSKIHCVAHFDNSDQNPN